MNFDYLLAARIIQGFSTSAFESLIIASVGDTYFVHQRGLRIGVINFILNAASSLSSIICGQVYASLGYYWLFHLFQVFLVIQFVAMFLFCPETTYLRDIESAVDVAQDSTQVGDKEKEAPSHVEVCPEPGTPNSASAPTSTKPKKTFLQELAVFNGVYSHEGVYKFFIGPLLALLNPAACYSILTSGLLNSWYVGSAIILSGVFSGAPWYYDAAHIGYLGAGPFIGGMLGSIVVACFSDRLIKYMGRLNGGI
jgi:MFS family permease